MTTTAVSQRPSGAAIVTTLRSASAYLDNFVEFHLGAGFDRLYLFLDDAGESASNEVRNHPKVTLIPRDDRLHETWRRLSRKSKLLAGLYKWRDAEVMARQLLNVQVAIDLARKTECRWLLSIDIDELFLCEEPMSVATHFRELDELKVTHVIYANHEVVPERWQVGDVLNECTLFKMSSFVLDPYQLLWFKHRFPRRLGYFNYHEAGKAAVRLSDEVSPGYYNPHEFLTGERRRHILHNLRMRVCIKTTRVVAPWLAQRVVVRQKVCTKPCILHYAISGFEQLANKYRVLGAFSDKWFGRVSIGNALPFHARAREVFASASASDAERFFRENVMFSAEDVEELIERGICRRILTVKDRLSSTRWQISGGRQSLP